MIKTCGNCIYMLDDGSGEPYCAIRDLYYAVRPEMLACDDYRKDNGNAVQKGFWLYNADLNKKLNKEGI